MTISFTVSGQCPSGKNAVVVTRTGHRFPSKRFKLWRTEALAELKGQIPKDFVTITGPCYVKIDYVAKDRRRRDAPGIIDALWHLCEKAELVKDDSLLGGKGTSILFTNYGIDKKNPRVSVKLDYLG